MHESNLFTFYKIERPTYNLKNLNVSGHIYFLEIHLKDHTLSSNFVCLSPLKPHQGSVSLK